MQISYLFKVGSLQTKMLTEIVNSLTTNDFFLFPSVILQLTYVSFIELLSSYCAFHDPSMKKHCPKLPILDQWDDNTELREKR